MKTAEEMRKIAEYKRLLPLKKILESIEIAAKNGETQMWWYDRISEECEKQLIELGYEVGDAVLDGKDHLTKISWT